MSFYAVKDVTVLCDWYSLNVGFGDKDCDANGFFLGFGEFFGKVWAKSSSHGGTFLIEFLATHTFVNTCVYWIFCSVSVWHILKVGLLEVCWQNFPTGRDLIVSSTGLISSGQPESLVVRRDDFCFDFWLCTWIWLVSARLFVKYFRKWGKRFFASTEFWIFRNST